MFRRPETDDHGGVGLTVAEEWLACGHNRYRILTSSCRGRAKVGVIQYPRYEKDAMTARSNAQTEPVLRLEVQRDVPDRVILTSQQRDALSTLLSAFQIPHESVSARIASSMRSASECVEKYFCGDFVIDMALRRVTRRGLDVELTPKEYDLLTALARRDGAAVERSTLLREVWGNSVSAKSRTLDQHILALRQKLEKGSARPTSIVTLRRFGFRLNGGWREVSTAGAASHRTNR